MPQVVIAIAAWAGGTLTTAMVVSAVVEVVMIAGAVYMANEQKKKMQAALRALDQAGMQVGVRNEGMVAQMWPYGISRYGGVMLDQFVTGGKNEYLNRVQVFAGCEVDSIVEVYFDESVAMQGNSAVWNHAAFWKGTGGPGQAGPTGSGAARRGMYSASFGQGRWTGTDTIAGKPFVAYKLYYDPKNNSFPNGAPQVTALIRGKKCLDIRDNVYRWTRNPVICQLDYMMSSSMHITEEYLESYRDEIIASANVCDEVINTAFPDVRYLPFVSGQLDLEITYEQRQGLYTGQYLSSSVLPPDTFIQGMYDYTDQEYDAEYGETIYGDTHYHIVLSGPTGPTATGTYPVYLSEREPRYTFDGGVFLDMKHKNILENFTNAHAGMTYEAGGQWCIQSGYYKTPDISIDENDILDTGGITISTHAEKSEVFNSIKPTFISPADFYVATEAPAITSSFYITRDQGEQVWQTLELPFCTSPIQAQRQAKIALFENRLDMMFTATVKYGAIRCKVGDNIYVNHTRYGWVNKIFKVVQMKIDYTNMKITLTCKETSPLVWDWTASDEQLYNSSPRSNLPDPRFVSTPFGISVVAGTAELKLLPDGTVIPQARVSWTTTGSVDWVEIFGKATTASVWSAIGTVPSDQTNIITAQVESGVQWDFGLYAVNSFNVRSPFITASAFIAGKTEPPTAPYNLTVVPGGGTITAHWIEPSDLDYFRTWVYVSTSSVFSEAYLYAKQPANSQTINVGSSLDVHYVWIRGEDTTGITSSLVGPESGSGTSLTSDPAVWGVVEDVFMMADYTGWIESSSIPWTTASCYINSRPGVYDAGLVGNGTFIVDTASVQGAATVTQSGQFMKIQLEDAPPQMTDPSYVIWYGRARAYNGNLYTITGSFKHYRVMEGIPGQPGPSASAGPSYGLQSDTANGVLNLISSGSVVPSGGGYKTPGSNNVGIWLGFWSGSVSMDLGNSGSYIRYNQVSSSVEIKADVFRHAVNYVITSSGQYTDSTMYGGDGSAIKIAGNNTFIAGTSYLDAKNIGGDTVRLNQGEMYFFNSSTPNELIQVERTGSKELHINQNLHISGGLGRLHGTASWAISASWAPSGASTNPSGSWTGSFSGSHIGNLDGTASWANNAITASYALNAAVAARSLYFDIRDFGAVADGVTDNSISLNTAIETASLQGGSVFIPSGSWATSLVLLKSNVKVFGEGWNSRLIALVNDTIVQSSGSELVNAELKDLQVDGNLRNNPDWNTGSIGALQGIGLECSSSMSSSIKIENIFVYDTRLEGIYVNQIGLQIRNSRFKWNGNGLEADGSGIVADNCPYVLIDGCDCTEVRGQFGISVQSMGHPFIVSNCLVTDSFADGYTLRGSNYSKVSNCITKRAGQRGFNLRGDTGGYGASANLTLDNVHVEACHTDYYAISSYQNTRLIIRNPMIVDCTNGIGLEQAGMD